MLSSFVHELFAASINSVIQCRGVKFLGTWHLNICVRVFPFLRCKFVVDKLSGFKLGTNPNGGNTNYLSTCESVPVRSISEQRQ